MWRTGKRFPPASSLLAFRMRRRMVRRMSEESPGVAYINLPILRLDPGLSRGASKDVPPPIQPDSIVDLLRNGMSGRRRRHRRQDGGGESRRHDGNPPVARTQLYSRQPTPAPPSSVGSPKPTGGRAPRLPCPTSSIGMPSCIIGSSPVRGTRSSARCTMCCDCSAIRRPGSR